MSRFESRTQRIVQYLEQHEAELPGPEHSRVSKLPGLIQRNGLLQTIAFLGVQSGKREQGDERAGEDGKLLDHLCGAIGAALGLADASGLLERQRLARCQPVEYLLLSEVALEVATWIARDAEARAQPEKR